MYCVVKAPPSHGEDFLLKRLLFKQSSSTDAFIFYLCVNRDTRRVHSKSGPDLHPVEYRLWMKPHRPPRRQSADRVRCFDFECRDYFVTKHVVETEIMYPIFAPVTYPEHLRNQTRLDLRPRSTPPVFARSITEYNLKPKDVSRFLR